MKRGSIGLLLFLLLSCGSSKEKIITELDPYGFPFKESLKKIKFESGKAKYQADYTNEFNNILSIITKFNAKGSFVFKIKAHSDSVGSAQSNMKLSQLRANKVMQTLINLGCNPNQLEAQGYGETQPIATNQTKEGRAHNRRVEIIVIPQN